MKPLPAAQQTHQDRTPVATIPALPVQPASPDNSPSPANQRIRSCATHQCYPWMLSASTAIAGLFCFLYITKPVTIAANGPSQSMANPEKSNLANPITYTPTGVSSSPAKLMPSADRLPGEQTASITRSKPSPTHPRTALPAPTSAGSFEETNLRIQHILTAEAPGGHLDRIDIDVPVLYHSRTLRWTEQEVAGARDLLVRLMDYQEKSLQLRSDGAALLDAWNRLIGNSIPATELRADSPSLPANQQDAADAPRPAGLSTTESIQIQSSGK